VSPSHRNLRGPKQLNFDLSALKDFRITETQALQFRVEMFNAPNHVELGVPSSSWNGSSGAANMRQIQFALKYNSDLDSAVVQAKRRAKPPAPP